MVGSLFAGTRESPGEVVERGGRRYKVSRGMASRGAAAARPDAESRADALDQYVPEGVETVIPLKESVGEIVAQLVGGLRSGMSYVGARTVAEFRADAEFMRITAAGMQESKPGEADA
jgi:IMP dehydrogenase